MILRLKSQKNDMKNRKIKSKKLERYLHHLYQFFLQIKLLERCLWFTRVTASQETFTSL